MAFTRFAALIVLVCLAAASSQGALAFRCNGDLISEGDSKLTVRASCGEPDWIDHWAEELIQSPDTDIERRLLRVDERWIYNQGPTQFLRIITFKNGRVTSIDTGGYGFVTTPGLQDCDLDSFSMGTTSLEVAQKCGQPDARERRIETVTVPALGGRQKTAVVVEEWTFNLGPRRFMRILTFRNGNLVGVRTGEKGFSE